MRVSFFCVSALGRSLVRRASPCAPVRLLAYAVTVESARDLATRGRRAAGICPCTGWPAGCDLLRIEELHLRSCLPRVPLARVCQAAAPTDCISTARVVFPL
ncbi:hypothetical protein BD414DRAFT_497431 [Trametes punicea]|nr:hypothetical protein BD414DRAFT_497431 [Trametes punicea]